MIWKGDGIIFNRVAGPGLSEKVPTKSKLKEVERARQISGRKPL